MPTPAPETVRDTTAMIAAMTPVLDEKRYVFCWTGDPDIGEFSDAVVLFKTGDVPDELPTG